MALCIFVYGCQRRCCLYMGRDVWVGAYRYLSTDFLKPGVTGVSSVHSTVLGLRTYTNHLWKCDKQGPTLLIPFFVYLWSVRSHFLPSIPKHEYYNFFHWFFMSYTETVSYQENHKPTVHTYMFKFSRSKPRNLLYTPHKR
jgi:hypothetical protein